jgi:hypothetical protein
MTPLPFPVYLPLLCFLLVWDQIPQVPRALQAPASTQDNLPYKQAKVLFLCHNVIIYWSESIRYHHMNDSFLQPSFSNPICTELECPICGDIFDNVVETPCCHACYCRTCIKDWIAKSSSCPDCRATIQVLLVVEDESALCRVNFY